LLTGALVYMVGIFEGLLVAMARSPRPE
jgi:hypothetical protein